MPRGSRFRGNDEAKRYRRESGDPVTPNPSRAAGHEGDALNTNSSGTSVTHTRVGAILPYSLAFFLVIASCWTTAQTPPLPKSPVTISVVDVAGDLALTQGAIEAYQAKNPNLVAKVNFTKAPAPELPAKLKAMQGAGRSDIDLVLTGVVALSAGIDQGLWVKLLPDHSAKFPGVMDNYLPAARKMQDLAQGEALVVTFIPQRPQPQYNPEQAQQSRTTTA